MKIGLFDVDGHNYRSCELEDYVPRKDGKTFKELYMGKEQE